MAETQIKLLKLKLLWGEESGRYHEVFLVTFLALGGKRNLFLHNNKKKKKEQVSE